MVISQTRSDIAGESLGKNFNGVPSGSRRRKSNVSFGVNFIITVCRQLKCTNVKVGFLIFAIGMTKLADATAGMLLLTVFRVEMALHDEFPNEQRIYGKSAKSIFDPQTGKFGKLIDSNFIFAHIGFCVGTIGKEIFGKAVS